MLFYSQSLTCKLVCAIPLIIVCAMSSPSWADGNAVGKIYHPYVHLLEKELEYRFLFEDDNEDSVVDHRKQHFFGLGYALSDRVAIEAYLIAVDAPRDSFELEAYELEAKWQLTEQGEYFVDWGMVVELEREQDNGLWETSATLVALYEWSHWLATGNFSLLYEWGSGIDNEWESALAAQLRYRLREAFEPALEIFSAQDTLAAGPVMTGLLRIGNRSKLRWAAGPIFGIESRSVDTTWKLELELEF